MAAKPVQRIALTPGEPAGIGPDIVVKLAQSSHPVELVVFADPQLLLDRARQLALPLVLHEYSPNTPPQLQQAGTLVIAPQSLRCRVVPGELSQANSAYVLNSLTQAVDFCQQGICQALLTGPVHKGIINQSGVAFTGHTEFLAELTHSLPVMMLANPTLRVALATTHLPLQQVSSVITQTHLSRLLGILICDLQKYWKIPSPRIRVCGLNPHAGEGGYLGDEEQKVILPVLQALGLENVTGPYPADTVFTPDSIAVCDAVLAMYHDQGLPVVKMAGLEQVVNITLGLPFLRLSVGHGTALSLAGTHQASERSLDTALSYLIGQHFF